MIVFWICIHIRLLRPLLLLAFVAAALAPHSKQLVVSSKRAT